MDNVIRLLSTSEPFAGLPPTAYQGLAALAQRRTIAAGEVLFRQDTPRAALYLIEAGRVGLSREGPRGHEELIALGPGTVLGESSLLHASLHSTTAAALDQVTLHELPRAAVLAHLAGDGTLAVEVLTRLALAMTRRLQFASPREVGLDKAYASGTVRREHDLLGERDVPADALFGVQTLRGVENPDHRRAAVPLPGPDPCLAQVGRQRRAPTPGSACSTRGWHAIDRACRDRRRPLARLLVVDMVQGGAGTRRT
jgi:aspartate ammonia-lyase